MSVAELVALSSSWPPVELADMRVTYGLSSKTPDRVTMQLVSFRDNNLAEVIEKEWAASALLSADPQRRRAFFEGTGRAAQRFVGEALKGDDGLSCDALDFFLPALLARSELCTAEDFERALVDLNGVRLEVEIDDFLAGLRNEFPVLECVRTRAEALLSYRILNCYHRAYSHDDALEALRTIQREGLQSLASVLVVFLDFSVEDINQRHVNRKDNYDKQDLAVGTLRKWGMSPPDERERWGEMIDPDMP